MSRAGKRNKNQDSAVTLVIWALVIIFAMPIAGGYLLFNGKSPAKMGLGLLLLILGIVIWVMLL